jgi:hypothetical protein
MENNVAQKMKVFFFAMFVSVISASPLAALAAGGVSGATAGISTAQTVIYSLLGAGAALYILIQGFLLKIKKIGWNNFFMAFIEVAVVAGSPALAVWFWDLGGN